MNVVLRTAAPEDYVFAERVFFTTQRSIIERLFGWRGDEFEHRRLREDHDFGRAEIVVVDGRDAGWLIANRLDDCVEIDGIYLLPEFQRRGIGSKLIADVIRDADLEGSPVRLSVAKVNPARSLYERLGFKVVGENEFKVFMERGPAVGRVP